MRWMQLQAVVNGGGKLPEPGLARALYARVTGEASWCAEAAHWAVASPPDLRQKALVLDWCGDLIPETEADSLASLVQREWEAARWDGSFGSARDRIFAAIALADRQPERSRAELQRLLGQWWESSGLPSLAASYASLSRRELLAVFEMLHAVRDNLKLDLRLSDPHLFQELPLTMLLGYYPMPLRTEHGLQFLPALKGAPAPSPDQALWARIAGLCLVAYDGTREQSQFLQGFLMQDPYLLRDPQGAVYEFLWANPYQPGLSYHHAPLFYHSRSLGLVFLRSSWNENAVWAGFLDGELQALDPEGLRVITAQPASKPVHVGPAALYMLQGRPPGKIQPPAAMVFLAGLKPQAEYSVELDIGKRYTDMTDRGGILAVTLDDRPGAWFRIR